MHPTATVVEISYFVVIIYASHHIMLEKSKRAFSSGAPQVRSTPICLSCTGYLFSEQIS